MRNLYASTGLAGVTAAILVGTTFFAVAQDHYADIMLLSAGDADFTAELTGASQVPAVETDATGAAYLAYDAETMELRWLVEYTGLTIVAAHFHGPAAEGENAGPIIDLCAAAEAFYNAGAADAGPEVGGAEEAIRNEDDDDADAPVGEAAAQAEAREGDQPDPMAGGMDMYVCGAPDPAGGEAAAQADALDMTGTRTLAGTATLTTEQAQQLSDGMWYVNLHTEAYPDGEIRGQLMATAE